MTARPPATAEPDYAALAQFRHLVRRFLAFSEKAAREAGLPPQQHQLLLSVKGLSAAGLPTIGALAWQLQLRHHTVGGLVQRMVSSSILRRVRHSSDQREVLVEVAPRGEALLRKLSIAHRDELRRLAPQLLPALISLFHPNQKEPAPWPTPSRSSSPGKAIRPERRRASPISRQRRGLSPSASLRLRSARSAPMSH